MNRRIFDTDDAQLEAAIDEVDALEDAKRAAAFHTALNFAAFFLVGVLFTLCWLSSEQEIIEVTGKFWMTILGGK